MSATLIANAQLVNEGQTFVGHVLIEGQYIKQIFNATEHPNASELANGASVIDANGHYLLPGLIDDQVHFREPGLTHKANIATESRAAVAGGITTYMEMPNTVPNTVTQELLEDKYQIAAETSAANYSFYMGGTNTNLDEVLKTDPKTVCGVKVFMGSSTGNMLVDSRETLNALFAECPMLIATHCEDEATVRANTALYKERYGEVVPWHCHPEIRSEEACYKSSSMAVELAIKHNTRLHILHISTAKELKLFDPNKPLSEKRITAEACIHHLWFTDADYARKGSRIKWNPAVKTAADRAAVREAINTNRIDVLATDHAPHTNEEKNNTYFSAPSGGPLVQHALPAALELVKQGVFSLETLVRKYCHAPAEMFQINKRGYLREGYFADLVLVNPNSSWTVSKENILYKCGWSPFEGETFSHKVTHTWVNGNLVWHNNVIDSEVRGMRLSFNR